MLIVVYKTNVDQGNRQPLQSRKSLYLPKSYQINNIVNIQVHHNVIKWMYLRFVFVFKTSDKVDWTFIFSG